MALTPCPHCSTPVDRRANTCPHCGGVLREALPPQTTGMMDVFALPVGVLVGLLGAVFLSRLPGDRPLLQVGLGVTGLLVPSLVGLLLANRGRLRALESAQDSGETQDSALDVKS